MTRGHAGRDLASIYCAASNTLGYCAASNTLLRIRCVRVCNMQSVISTNIQNQTFQVDMADTVAPHFCLPSPSRRNFEIEHPRCTWATRLRRASATAAGLATCRCASMAHVSASMLAASAAARSAKSAASTASRSHAGAEGETAAAGGMGEDEVSRGRS